MNTILSEKINEIIKIADSCPEIYRLNVSRSSYESY